MNQEATLNVFPQIIIEMSKQTDETKQCNLFMALICCRKTHLVQIYGEEIKDGT